MASGIDVNDIWNKSWNIEVDEIKQLKGEAYDFAELRQTKRTTKANPDGENISWWFENGKKFLDSWIEWRKNSGWAIWTTPTGEPGIELVMEIEVGGISFKGAIDRIFVTVGAGGGTGAGVCSELIKTVREYQQTVKATSPYVGVVLALPKLSEGKKVSLNAYETLKEVCQLVEDKVVSPLIILDNEKINALYPKLPVSNFWQVANSNISALFHLFNNIVTKSSQHSTFDSNDLRTVLDSGIMVFGMTNVPNLSSEADISKAVRENLKRNVLCGDLDLSSGKIAATVAIADEKTLDSIPQEYLDNAFNQLNRTLQSGSTVHQGVYKGNKEGLSIFTAIAGISTPQAKLDALLKSSE